MFNKKDKKKTAIPFARVYYRCSGSNVKQKDKKIFDGPESLLADNFHLTVREIVLSLGAIENTVSDIPNERTLIFALLLSFLALFVTLTSTPEKVVVVQTV